MDGEKIKLGLWSGAGGAIVATFLGFNFGGWTTNGNAEVMAKQAAATAVADRLGTICVAQLDRDAAKGQKLKEMQAKDSWDRSRFIETQSWAIMPGDEKPENGVADACAKLLSAKA